MLAEALPTDGEVAAGPGTIGQPAFRVPARRARGRERDLTGSLAIRPHAFALILDPGRAGETSSLAVSPMLPPVFRQRRPQREEHIGADSQGFSICCLRFTNDVAAAHARLASGWRTAPLPGGTRTLWIASKGFRSCPSPFPGLSLSQRKLL